jgi:hypothetical protein
VSHQPPAGLPYSLPIRAQRRGNDVVVAMDRDVDIAEGVDKLNRLRARLTEMPVEDDSDIGSVEPAVPRTPGRPLRTVPVTFIVWIRLTVARQSTVGMLLMQTQSVFEQGDLGSEQSRLGRHAHRRTGDSFLSIMTAIVPSRAHVGKRQRPSCRTDVRARQATERDGCSPTSAQTGTSRQIWMPSRPCYSLYPR